MIEAKLKAKMQHGNHRQLFRPRSLRTPAAFSFAAHHVMAGSFFSPLRAKPVYSEGQQIVQFLQSVVANTQLCFMQISCEM